VDDVIRITVNYLVFGDPTGATYDTKLAYSDNHTALNTSGPEAFPYLAPPL
jgi:hypothetical protein